MKFKEGIPSRKGMYLMTTATGNSLRMVRIRGLDNSALQSDPGVYGGKIYEFLSIAKREWVRFEVETRGKETMWSPRIRQAVGFGLEPQEPNEPKAPKVIVELTHEQSLDADLVRRIKASGACWQVDMHQHLRDEFSAMYSKEVAPISWNNLTKEPHGQAAQFAWKMFKQARGIK